MQSNTNQDRVIKRLMKDLKEIQMNPLETVYAEPFKGDLFHWYATVLAPKTSKYCGMITVLEIDFPHDYPNSPPTIHCLTNLHHSHVFSGWICLDILESHHFSQVPYMGWSTSYSCLSILLQLQSFLLEEEEKQARYIQEDVDLSRQFRNMEIGHDPENSVIYPCAPHWNVKDILEAKYEPPKLHAAVSKKAFAGEKVVKPAIKSKKNRKNRKKNSVVFIETRADIAKKLEPKKVLEEKVSIKEKVMEETSVVIHHIPQSFTETLLSQIQGYILKLLNQMGVYNS